MFEEILVTWDAGTRFVYQGAQYIVIRHIDLKTTDGMDMVFAVKDGDSFPAQLVLVPFNRQMVVNAEEETNEESFGETP